MARMIDADKITSESKFTKSVVRLFKSCKMKHRDACLAPNCEECFERIFNSFNLLPFLDELSGEICAEPVRRRGAKMDLGDEEN